MSEISRLTRSSLADAVHSDGKNRLDRLELLERLAAAAAVADRPARRGAADVLQLRVGRAAVRAAESAASELDERRCARLPRRRGCESRLPELLATRRSDPVGRPRVVEHDLHVRHGAELLDLRRHPVAHRLERRAAEERRRELDVNPLALDVHVPHDAELDDRDDRDLGILDLLERSPHGRRSYQAAPGTERRTIVISSQSSVQSSTCTPRSAASNTVLLARPKRSPSEGRSSSSRSPSAYGHSSSSASR